MPSTVRKSRYWGFILYPESAPKTWLDILINTRLKFVVSPLHDSDLWTEYEISKKAKYCEEHNIKVNDVKKPHYHIVICYGNTTTENSILKVLEELGITYVEPINSVIGQYDYFTHKHNEDKFPYNESDIKSYNGFNIADYYELSSKETLAIKMWVIDYVCDKKIYHYDDLINQLMRYQLLDELSIVMNNTMFFNSYLKSRFSRIGDITKITDSKIK